MQQALQAVENGLSHRKAAKLYGVPPTTLRGRMEGAVAIKQFAIDRQALSDVQETQLVQWAHVQDALGMPPTHYQLRCAAEEILRASGTQKKLGKNWVTNFMRRHPSLGTLQGKRLDIKRAKDVTPDKIKGLFDTLDGPLLRHV